MKELTSYNRVAGYLNKLFDLLNQEFFEGTLSRPTITIQSTPKAYGHFSLRNDTWISKKGATHEINIGAGTLARPIEEVAATLLHEMVHYHCYVNGIQDCSRGGTYHNRRFRDSAEAHGLIVKHHEKYGWTTTSPSDVLLQFCLDNDLTDILINRNEFYGFRVPVGGTANTTGTPLPRKNLQHPQVRLPLLRQLCPGHQDGQHRMSGLRQADGAGRITGGRAMFVLDKLWRGTLSPNEQCVLHNSEYSALQHKATQLSKQILSSLSDDGKRIFQEYQDLREQMAYISEEDTFINGFRIGVGLFLDAVSTYDSQFVRYHED